MGQIYSANELWTQFQNFQRTLNVITAGVRRVDDYVRTQRRQGTSEVTIKTYVTARYAELEDMLDQLRTELAAVPWVHQSEIEVGRPAYFTASALITNATLNSDFPGADVTWDGGAIYADMAGVDLEADICAEFSTFVANDIVEVTNAEDSGNKRTYRLEVAPLTSSVDNVISNGSFENSGTDWTLGSGWAVAGRKLEHTTGNTADAEQANADLATALVLNQWYLLRFTISGRTAGGCAAHIAGLSTANLTANQSYAFLVQCTNISTNTLIFRPESAFDGDIEDVSLVPFSGVILYDEIPTGNTTDTQLKMRLINR